MIEHASHTGFIVAAYVVAGVVVGTMIGSTVLDYRGLRRALSRFGTRGLDNRE